MRYLTLLLLSFALLTGACNKDAESQAEEDQILIENYLMENNITAQMTPEGLHYVITEAGNSEAMPTINSTVEVKYIGRFLDNSVFDQTAGSMTFTSPLSGLIPGWQIGIPLMQRGGKATLYIPSGLGYGRNSPPGIPANSVLIFEIELIDFSG